tara:strand:+ start:27285 stop:28268 length:984 start_codon:yes stop_codon:yes gene_type:complete
MYGQQKLLRIKNIIDIYKNDACSKCGTAIASDQKEQILLYSRNDVSPIRDYYKKINFLSVKMFVGNTKVSQVNFLDNKVKILHSEYFRDKEFHFDDTIYLLPFLKALHIYSRNNLPTTLRKLLIDDYNQFLIKAVQSNSDSDNATYGKHISNYSPSEKLVKMFQSAKPIIVDQEIKGFVSQKFYEKYEGQELFLIINENSQENFLNQYTTSDKDNHLVWLMIDDFTKWYIKNSDNYKFLCSICLGKAEFKRSRRLLPILDETFENKEIVDLRQEFRDKVIARVKRDQEETKRMYKEFRPKAYEAQYGTTETIIKDGKKTTITNIKKK